MYCKKCGAIIPAESSKCEKCGAEITPNMAESAVIPEAQEATANNTNNSTALSTPVQKHQTSTLKTKLTVWCWLAIVSLCCGAFTLYKGFDKMFRYDFGDSYPHKYVNAYVGGDAYNYIINGTYATAYFVLTAMFVLAAIGLVIIHYLSKREVK